MTNSQRLSLVRSALRKWITDQHPGEDGYGSPLSEAVLIRDGYFCGRRFHFPIYHAVWFLEEDEVKILTLQGEVVGRLDANAISTLAQAGDQTPLEAPHTLSITSHVENTLAATAIPADLDNRSRTSLDHQHRRAA